MDPEISAILTEWAILLVKASQRDNGDFPFPNKEMTSWDFYSMSSTTHPNLGHMEVFSVSYQDQELGAFFE